MKRMLFQIAAAMVMGVSCAFAQTVSVKSPNGANEIRLMTEPTLSYAVYHAGLERVAPTPIALTIEGVGTLGGATTKILSADTVSMKGKIPSPLYKKAFVDESANRTTVAFEGNWRVVLIARNDGVAYRFETDLPGRIKVQEETAGIVFPGLCDDYGAVSSHGNRDVQGWRVGFCSMCGWTCGRH